MDPEDIKDRKSLEAWLNARPKATRQSDAIAIAQRSALRVFPLCGRDMERERARKADLTALPVLRRLLTSGVARKYPTREVKAASASASASASAASASDGAAFAAADSARASASAASASASAAYAADAAAYAAAADSAAASAAAAIWNTIRVEARSLNQGDDPFTAPLWSNTPPDWFTTADTKTRAIWAKDPPGTWDFWTRWWDGVLSGQQLPWDLQKAVALIPNAIWQQGPAVVAEAIRQIELDFAISQTPNAEILRVNPATGLIAAEPVSHLPGNHLNDIVDTLQDASRIFDGSGGPNGPYGQLQPEVELIRDACERYRHRPIMLLRLCRRVVERARLKEAAGDCPKDDPLVRDFIGSVVGAAGDLMAFDPDVREAETARVAANPPPPSAEIAQKLVEAADASAEISEGDLKAELPEDARLAVADGSEETRQVAIYQTKSRLLRVFAIVKSKGKGVVEHGEKYPLTYGTLLAVLLFLLA